MNKTLYGSILCSLNRAVAGAECNTVIELKRVANRGLSLNNLNNLNNVRRQVFISTPKTWPFWVCLLISLFCSQSASAGTFYWTVTGWAGQYSSPSAACEAKRLGATVYQFSNAVLIQASAGDCQSIRTDGVKVRFGNLARWGDSCPPEATYNATTGECANDPQKGNPGTCPVAVAGNPINTAIGNKFQTETDHLGSGAFPLAFSRTYNSLGGVWRHNHSTYLRLTSFAVALVMADGRESFFTLSGATVMAAPTELGNLVKTADGWLYTAANNERFTFDTAGRLTQWTNSSGAKHLLAYAYGKVTVTDQLGQSLSFTEDANHQPLSLTASGLQISYSYNANKRLTQLIRTRGAQTEQRTFHYEDARNNALLTGITDERGVRFATWSYDAKGRAISSEHAGGVERGTVTYNVDGSSTVTNELGKNTTYRFVNIGGVKRVSAVEGEPSANCPNSNSTFTYDSRGLLKTKTDNKGHLTTFDYNERGLEVSRTEAAGTPQARTVTTDWHPTLFLPVTVTEPSRITHYTYDDQGRQLSQSVTQR